MGDKLNTNDGSAPTSKNKRAAAKVGDNAEHGSADPRLAGLDRLRHTERAIAVERLLAHVAHELGTPLNVIEARALMMVSGDATGAEIQKHARSIADQAGRMTKIIRENLERTRWLAPQKAHVDLLAVAKTALSLASVTGGRLGVRLALDPSSCTADVLGDEDSLLQAAMNLALNGVEATPEGGSVVVATRRQSRPSVEDPKGPLAEFATLEVRDEGPGISQESLPLLWQPLQIWKPFFATKPDGSGGGRGLGLSIAQRLVRDHGGWIEVASDVGRGSCFTVYLPRGDS